ncbi:MAG: M23 family metallopeptidase [Chloroflexi bacterium]|nr:M23 family metallopeptidase [Chloroflexota bacterium]
MKTKHRTYLAVAFATIAVLSVLGLVLAAPDRAGAWRLPFDGLKVISNAPGIRTHTGRSSQAIDYVSHPNRESFAVYAPADGVVLDVLSVSDFGTVLRINHNNVYSFFAHLRANQVQVSAGDTVRQGQLIAMTGNSGTGGESNHLHFEARTGAVAGNVYSGSAYSIKAIPGNWWNKAYVPPPFLTVTPTSIYNGGAQFPENSARPTTANKGARHLADIQSPPNPNDGWISNITDGTNAQAVMHFAANPNVRGTGYRTWFSLFKRQNNDWPQKLYGTRAAFADSIGPGTESFENGQHMYVSYDWNQISGRPNLAHVYELWPGVSAQGIPHIAASYKENNDSTVLEYCAPNGAEYYVSEYHGNATEFTYQGPACSILVHRRLNELNSYNVSVRYQGQSGWSNPSLWLDLHY